MTFYHQYWDTSVSLSQADQEKVCALCDRNFPLSTKETQAVEVTAIDGKPVESTTYLMMPKAAIKQIQREFGVIDTDTVTIS